MAEAANDFGGAVLATPVMAHGTTQGLESTGTSKPGADSAEDLVLTPDDDISEFSLSSDIGEVEKSWPDRLVIYMDNKWRVRWNVVVFLMLVYIATLFPYRFTFIESHMPKGMQITTFWQVIGFVIDALFWIDLLANFFFTYIKDGEEVDSLFSICKNYLKGFFIWNLIACLPAEFFSPIMTWAFGRVDGGATSGHKLTRLSRLQRTTRLIRLTRLGRLAVLFKFKNNDYWNYIKGTRGMRIVNFVGFLLWTVHLMACGWYFCAVLHSDQSTTWVYRRVVDDNDKRLLEETPVVQWCHSMYFVLTVFTTVGFGDMSAWTVGEIVYVSFTMLVGVIVNSIIVGEVINIVSTMDATQVNIQKTKEVIDGFSAHCHLNKNIIEALHLWIEQMSYKDDFVRSFDRRAMRDLVTSGKLPHKLLKQLPDHVFQGRLKASSFIATCLTQTIEVPPRLTVLLALSLSSRVFANGEVVYQLHDTPFNIFLVDAGIFAFVGRPTPSGGEDEPASTIGKREERNALKAFKAKSLTKAGLKRVLTKSVHLYPYQLFCSGSYFGDYEMLENAVRHCTARCEGQNGRREPTLLVLHKPDYFRLIDEFPHCANAWIAKARMHERRRLERLADLYEGRNIKHLAASMIQTFYQQRKAKKLKSSSKLLEPVHEEPLNENDTFDRTLKPQGSLQSQGMQSQDILRSQGSLKVTPSSSLYLRANSTTSQFMSPHRRRRFLGGSSSQLEERSSETPLGQDSFPARAAIAELREEIKTLQKSVDFIHRAIDSSNLGGNSWPLKATEYEI